MPTNKYKNIKTLKTDQGKSYKNNSVLPDSTPSVQDIYVITTNGDRLDNLAFEFYNDTSLWWVIAAANPDKLRRDTFYVDGGLQIRIPTDPRGYVTSYNVLNKNGR